MGSLLIRMLLLSFFFLSVQKTNCTDFVGTFLFECKREGKKSYLLGTFHGLPYERLPKSLISRLDQCTVLITENSNILNPLDQSSLAVMGILKSPGEPNYIGMLMADEKRELLAYVDPFLKNKGGNVQADQLNLRGLLETYIGGHFVGGMDYWLLQSFNKASKEIQGLESREEVSSSFADVTFDNLQQIIRNKAGFESDEAKKVEEDYLSGVTPNGEKDDVDETCKRRNQAWLPRILKYHDQYLDNMIMAVGYRHLFGEDGLLRLLSKEGFAFKRMSINGNFMEYK